MTTRGSPEQDVNKCHKYNKSADFSRGFCEVIRDDGLGKFLGKSIKSSTKTSTKTFYAYLCLMQVLECTPLLTNAVRLFQTIFAVDFGGKLTPRFCRWSTSPAGSSGRGCLARRRATCRCAGSANSRLVLAPPVGKAPTPPGNSLAGSCWASPVPSIWCRILIGRDKTN